MIKVLICVCMTVCCYYIGGVFCKRYKERRNLFFSLVSFCNAYEANLNFYKKKLEIFVREFVAADGNKNFKMLASKGLGMEFNVKKVGVLEERLNQALPLLTEEQTAYIDGFFKILGKGDASGQKTQLKTYKFYFEEQLKKATDNFDKKGKMCNKLGLLCGIFLSILVI